MTLAREKKFIKEKMDRVLLKEFLKERTERAGFGGCDVSRTPMGTRITLHIERPSLVIGRKGRTIRKITRDVKDKFGFDNPQIEVQEVKVPELNPQIMAEKLAQSLERGWHFRRAGHSTVRRIMDSGARGCQIILSGKITGPRHRVEKFKDGHIKYCGEEKNKWMREGYSAAKVKLGMIGVTVQIMDPEAKLPDEIEIIPPSVEEEEIEDSEDEVQEEKEETPDEKKDTDESEEVQDEKEETPDEKVDTDESEEVQDEVEEMDIEEESDDEKEEKDDGEDD